MNSFIITFAKWSEWFIKTFNLGSGSTWPGHIALKIKGDIIHDILSANNTQVVLIAGTNGKTTTSKLLRHILEKSGKKVFQNEEGANLLNGIASSIIRKSTVFGKLTYDVAIFEVDENTIPQILKQVKPHAIIILNLFRDQLDRYGEVNVIAQNWAKAFKDLPSDTHLILNGDDPQIYYLGKDLNTTTVYYGLSEKFLKPKEIPHDVDSVYCPICGTHLKYETMSYSHLGDFACPNCDFKREHVETFSQETIQYPLLGMYNVYNIHAVLLTVREAFGMKVEEAVAFMQDFTAAFGRQEKITYRGRTIIMLLSKNPTGFNQSIELVRDHFKEKEVNALVILNDRIPDGTDVSWIWDVEYERLVPYVNQLVVSGDRTYDMAIRMKNTCEREPEVKQEGDAYFFEHVTVQEDVKNAIEIAVEKTPESGTLIILPTYSAMLETRGILLGRKIL